MGDAYYSERAYRYFIFKNITLHNHLLINSVMDSSFYIVI